MGWTRLGPMDVDEADAQAIAHAPTDVGLLLAVVEPIRPIWQRWVDAGRPPLTNDIDFMPITLALHDSIMAFDRLEAAE